MKSIRRIVKKVAPELDSLLNPTEDAPKGPRFKRPVPEQLSLAAAHVADEEAPAVDLAARERADAAEKAKGVDYAAVIARYTHPAYIGNSRQKAIRAFCIQCCVGQMAEVRQCTAVKCALHPFRMGDRPGSAAAARRAAAADDGVEREAEEDGE